jgi:hypothetical protein
VQHLSDPVLRRLRRLLLPGLLLAKSSQRIRQTNSCLENSIEAGIPLLVEMASSSQICSHMRVTWSCVARAQAEVLLQFFVGYHTEDNRYCDDILALARRNLSSLTGFWFDCVTSIPFSFIDLSMYMVPSPARSLTAPALVCDPTTAAAAAHTVFRPT